jgi:hypothetical protein
VRGRGVGDTEPDWTRHHEPVMRGAAAMRVVAQQNA